MNQLCNTRLGTNQHQRLLLLRQRQLIEEDELRLKHYVEYEKFQKALRQCTQLNRFCFNYLYINYCMYLQHLAQTLQLLLRIIRQLLLRFRLI